jgi:hypothetical protein
VLMCALHNSKQLSNGVRIKGLWKVKVGIWRRQKNQERFGKKFISEVI